ncbi:MULTISPECIES: PLD nuclease N-terminal domain-containing protein [Arthrobacter]|uniref:PLD nuclease N-terminal domain-containing protein n=1 Tax=unclassified Arthrobacter TaxID=235627 RepID=UPI0024BA84E3|nr:PLDc N-terminal domain-containing protein [Arthrobacter sp. H35-MC1]MDJ0316866.1 PLDc N-terminal domain-containing protein [Arthrobacter sp. H35-MC1]
MRYIIPTALAVVLFVYGLIDCLRSEPSDVRSIPKSAWIVVIVLLNVIGVALWFLFGRPQYAAAAPGSAQRSNGSTGSQRGPSFQGSSGRSVAPDDNPEFLRNLEVNRAQKSEAERLRKLKADLDAREAKLREEHPNDDTKK